MPKWEKLGASFDPSMIRDDQWKFTGWSSDGLRKHYTYTDPALNITIQKTENLLDAEIIEDNKQSYNDSDGKRWGDGKVVASIPLNVLYRDFEGRWNDPDFTDWYLNNPENRHWRKFKGNV